MEREFTPCPECGLPAEVQYRSVLQSTDGPVEHVKTRCVTGHWFFMEAQPADQAPRRARAGAAVSAVT
jgi:hypothetical protein